MTPEEREDVCRELTDILLQKFHVSERMPSSWKRNRLRWELGVKIPNMERKKCIDELAEHFDCSPAEINKLIRYITKVKMPNDAITLIA